MKACICGNLEFRQIKVFNAPPKGETPYGGVSAYSRELVQCSRCAHFRNFHRMFRSGFYSGGYVKGTYGGLEGIKKAYARVEALPPALSDNAGRVAKVHAWVQQYGGTKRKLLDIGSGLGIFPKKIKELGFQPTALDPDPIAVQHAREDLGLKVLCGDFFELSPEERFDLITLNKVLEHVENPVVFLSRAESWLQPSGFLYLEVPDGESAIKEGPERQEFFVDHPHIFSGFSTEILVKKAGFEILEVERLREPSGKFTLRAFVKPLPLSLRKSAPYQTSGAHQ